MKILWIKIKNLASLEGFNEIDFTKEPLRSAGIFAITGPTGSGKSTLLDALCLALFAKTPRHENTNTIQIEDVGKHLINQNDVRGILSKGCAEGYAEVQFIGVDNEIHQAKYTMNRARNTIGGALQPFTVHLKNITTNTVFPDHRKSIVLPEIERLVGLNFEQFTRSVLLAQGEFTAFLKADNDQKSSLLEKLTGTDIYSEISKTIYKNYKEAEQGYNLLQSQMQVINLLPEEELILLNNQNNNISEKLLSNEIVKTKLEQDVNWHHIFIDLTQNKLAAEAALQVVKNNKEAAQERTNTFNLVESVQPAREIFTTKSFLITQATNNSTTLDTLQLNIDQLKKDDELVSTLLTDANNNLIFFENTYTQAKPAIEQAKVLDTVIREKNELVLQATTEVTNAVKNKEAHQTIIEEREAAIKTISQNITDLQQWKENNETREPIAINKDIIILKLADAGKLSDQEKTLTNALIIDQKKLQQKIDLHNQIRKEINNATDTFEKLTALNETTAAAFNVIKIAELISTEISLRNAIDEIVPATACWEILFSNQKELDAIENKIDQNRIDISNKKIELNQQNINLEHAMIKKDQAEKIYNEAILQTQKSVQEMRSQLKPESPCPVCGSLQHPFALNDPALNVVIKMLEKEDIDCKKVYENIQTICNTLIADIKNKEGNNTDLEKDRSIRKSKVADETAKWQVFKLAATGLSIPEKERLDWLRSEEQKARNEYQIIDQQLKAYELLKNKSAAQKSEITKVENELIQSKSTLTVIENDQQHLIEECNRLTNELVVVKQNITLIINQNDTYFNDNNWKDKWQQDPALFIQKVNHFSNEWNSNMLALENDNHILQNLNTQLNGLMQQMQQFIDVVNTAHDKLQILQQSLLTNTTARAQLLNGDPIKIVEQNFMNAIDIGKEIVKNHSAKKDACNNDLILANSKKQQLEIEKIKLDDDIVLITAQLTVWLTAYNTENAALLNETDIAKLLAYSQLWITEERKFLLLIEKAIDDATATFNERNLRSLQHAANNTPLQTLDDLALTLSDLRVIMDRDREEITANKLKLLQHANNENQLGNLKIETEIKKVIYENWHKLNDVIGSADGRKFRQYAQEYTLDVLLSFANVHLTDLATRYKLGRIPASLSLKVIDRDMGDEVRSVNTLSGGESFLVSLALALGLASLSSNKMKVESLFIDEGFGSLDPATLIIAMDALAKLQDQGRKVGVISHVVEMTENIPTQIKISKISHGRSKLTIVSNQLLQ